MASPAGGHRVVRRAAAAVAAAAVLVMAVACGGGGGAAAAAELPNWSAGLNQYAFTALNDFTDEFLGSWLNKTKWQDWNPHWIGRAPAVFKWTNIFLNRGDVALKARRDTQWNFPPNPPSLADEPPIYTTWTSAFMQSRQAVLYGFFEVRAKPMDSVFSSAFWFSSNTATQWTEIDVFEIGGGASGGPGPGHPYIMHTNFHVFRDAKRGISPSRPVSAPRNTVHSSRLADKYHTYAVDWSADRIQWLFNGRVVRSERNVGHHQHLRLKLDSESFPYWFGLPDASFSSSIYRVAYVRGWSKSNRWRRSGGGRGNPPPQPLSPGGGRTGGNAGRLAGASPPNGTVGVAGEPVFVVSAAASDAAEAALLTETVSAATLNEDEGVSPWALQRMPSRNSPAKLLLSPPVPAAGWVPSAGRVPRRADDWPPRPLGPDSLGKWHAGD